MFYGKGQSLTSIKKLCGDTRAQVQYLESVRGGKNSIDFQIITELGVLVGRGEADFAYVISQDKGYEAAMSALRARYADTFQEVALRPSIQSWPAGGVPAALRYAGGTLRLVGAGIRPCAGCPGLQPPAGAFCPASRGGETRPLPPPQALRCQDLPEYSGTCRSRTGNSRRP